MYHIVVLPIKNLKIAGGKITMFRYYINNHRLYISKYLKCR